MHGCIQHVTYQHHVGADHLAVGEPQDVTHDNVAPPHGLEGTVAQYVHRPVVGGSVGQQLPPRVNARKMERHWA